MLTRGKWVKVGIILATILFFIVGTNTIISGHWSDGWVKTVEFRETYCDYVDGSWIVTLKLKSVGKSLGLPQIIGFYVKHQDVQVQVFDVTFVDSTGKIHLGDILNSFPPPVIWDVGYVYLQFRVPEKVLTGESIQIFLECSGRQHAVYEKTIRFERNNSVDVFSLSEENYMAWVYRYRVYYMRQWVPQYILICCWLGVFLDVFLTHRYSRLSNHSVNVNCG